MSGSRSRISRIWLLLAALLWHPAPALAYDFGGVSDEALALYRRGWVEILYHGRWSEAERLYRASLRADPQFTVARSVLARITDDPAEREALYRQVQADFPHVDDDARLLLTTYQRTLELFARRDTGNGFSDAERTAMASRAARDYGVFLQRHPQEWSVMIEYVEWIHALDGPGAALAAIERLRSELGPATEFSYFPAYFRAELGQHDRARELADAFAARIGDTSAPQTHFINAYLHFRRGELQRAQASIKRTLALEPRHLLAARLRQQIEAALSSAVAGSVENDGT